MKFLLDNVPFHSQKWDLSNWQKLGFNSPEDAEYWQDSSCGVLCLKMILDTYKENYFPVKHMIDRGTVLKAYTHDHGWKHDGLARLAETYGLTATPQEHIDEHKLKYILLSRKFPIVSIKWAFEPKKSLKELLLPAKKSGGHLALVTGFEEDDKSQLSGFYVHHTSVKPEYNWQYKFIPLETFKEGFTGRTIIIG